MVKRSRRGNPAWTKGGPSPNPSGRPSEGQSWAAVLRDITDRTAEDLASMVGGTKTKLGRQLLALPRGIALKYLVATRAISELMRDPSSSLLRVIMDGEQLADLEARISALEARGR